MHILCAIREYGLCTLHFVGQALSGPDVSFADVDSVRGSESATSRSEDRHSPPQVGIRVGPLRADAIDASVVDMPSTRDASNGALPT